MDVYEALIRELGSDRVLRGPAAVAPYARDESGLGIYPPDAAVLCRTRAEVELVLRFAAVNKIPATPRGTGSGMTGGALPIRGGIVLSTEQMKRIVSIDPEDRIAVIEPGVINADLQLAVEAQGLFYARDPASWSSARWAATSPRTPAARARSSTASPATGRWAWTSR